MRLTLLLGFCLASAEGFTVLPTTGSQASIVSTARLGRAKPPMHVSQTVSSTLSSPASSSHLSMFPPTGLSFTSTSELLTDSSLVQAEFLNGMTHALLDFTTLWGATAVVIRLAAVIGRLFVVAQDFIPGHEVLPDELAFQFVMLALSSHALITAVLPKIQAQFAVPHLMTGQDRKAFRSLFRPAGISWRQYKELHLCSMDWVTVEPGHVVLSEEGDEDIKTSTKDSADNDAVYWLYQGNVQVKSNGTVRHNISNLKKEDEDDSTSSDAETAAPGLRLLGEKRLANLLDRNHGRKQQQKDSSFHKVTVVAGDSGAMLLRMNTTKLGKLLQHDPELTSSVARLAFQGMQDKLDALWMKEQAIVSSPIIRAANSTEAVLA